MHSGTEAITIHGLVRVSVGFQYPENIISDLDQAFESI